MMNAHGVDLVLPRLSSVGCNPRRLGTDAWQVPCPVHRGPYPALLVSRSRDGWVSVKCRYLNPKGELCPEAEIWESLGLQPRQLERALVATAQIDCSGEPGAQPSATVNSHSEAPVRQRAAEPKESPSTGDHDAAPAPLSHAQAPALTLDVSVTVPEMPQGEPCGVGGAELRHTQPGDWPKVAAAAEDVAAAVSSQQTTSAAKVPKRSARAGGAIGDRSGRNDGSHAGMLRSLARQVRVVCGLDHRFYAQVPIAGHHEIHELRSLSFEYWLILNYCQRQQAPPARARLNSLIRTFEADAAALGSTETVWVRVADGTGRAPAGSQAKADGRPDVRVPSGPGAATVYYLDLGDSSWQSMESRAEGCRIVDHALVLFRRPRGLRPLPEPQWDGSIDLLKKYTNVNDADFPLLVGWMTAALRPVVPFPILILTGEQGSAKSTMARGAPADRSQLGAFKRAARKPARFHDPGPQHMGPGV